MSINVFAGNLNCHTLQYIGSYILPCSDSNILIHTFNRGYTSLQYKQVGRDFFSKATCHGQMIAGHVMFFH